MLNACKDQHFNPVAFVFIINATINLRRNVEQGSAIKGDTAHPYNPKTSAKMRIRTIVTNTFDSYTYALTH